MMKNQVYRVLHAAALVLLVTHPVVSAEDNSDKNILTSLWDMAKEKLLEKLGDKHIDPKQFSGVLLQLMEPNAYEYKGGWTFDGKRGHGFFSTDLPPIFRQEEHKVQYGCDAPYTTDLKHPQLRLYCWDGSIIKKVIVRKAIPGTQPDKKTPPKFEPCPYGDKSANYLLLEGPDFCAYAVKQDGSDTGMGQYRPSSTDAVLLPNQHGHQDGKPIHKRLLYVYTGWVFSGMMGRVVSGTDRPPVYLRSQQACASPYVTKDDDQVLKQFCWHPSLVQAQPKVMPKPRPSPPRTGPPPPSFGRRLLDKATDFVIEYGVKTREDRQREEQARRAQPPIPVPPPSSDAAAMMCKDRPNHLVIDAIDACFYAVGKKSSMGGKSTCPAAPKGLRLMPASAATSPTDDDACLWLKQWA